MRNTVRTAAAVAVLALSLAACGTSGDGSSSSAPAAVIGASQKPAIDLDTPYAKPDLVLTDSQGKKYDLVKETAGHPTLLYFGYTHCPDVCPTTMSDLAIAKSRLSKADQAALRVVFITTDPERDTPKRLAAWLGSMDTSFIGLTGDFSEIQAGARALGVDVEKPVKKKDGTVSVTHGAQVIAFSPKDNKAHAVYLQGTTSAQYAHDLPEIIKGQTP